MPPDEENLFEQGYIPYIRIDDHVRSIPIIYIDQDYLECMWRIYAYDGAGVEIIHMSQAPLTTHEGIAAYVDAINQAFSYAVEHCITDRRALCEVFSGIDILTPGATTHLAEYTSRIALEFELKRRTRPDAMAGVAQQVLRQDNHIEELVDRVRDMELVMTAQDDVHPLRFEHIGSRIFTPVFSEQNATLVEAEPTPFSDEELDTLLFEGA